MQNKEASENHMQSSAAELSHTNAYGMPAKL
jgi:hypothetical protein